MSPTDARRPRGRAGTGFWLIAAAFLTAMASTTLQTPLYPLYQRQQGFATFVITVIFAAFAVGVVAGLWLIGHISDAVGRRPMVLLGILLQIPAALIDIIWDGVPGLLIARGHIRCRGRGNDRCRRRIPGRTA